MQQAITHRSKEKLMTSSSTIYIIFRMLVGFCHDFLPMKIQICLQNLNWKNNATTFSFEHHRSSLAFAKKKLLVGLKKLTDRSARQLTSYNYLPTVLHDQKRIMDFGSECVKLCFAHSASLGTSEKGPSLIVAGKIHRKSGLSPFVSGTFSN